MTVAPLGTNYRLAIGIPVKDVARYLPHLFEVLHEVASVCTDVRIVLVENDSADETADLTAAFAKRDRRVSFMQYPGLGELVPERTDRLAFLRNSIVEELVALSGCEDGWTAVMLDADEVTSELTTADVFQLVDFLHEHPEYSGATANSKPIYYDVWTLRCEGWSPDDCWARVDQRPASVSRSEAVRAFVAARQRPIDSASPPISVASAFGGLAAYRLNDVKRCRYGGHSGAGHVCSDHVPMHADLTTLTGKPLAIVPSVNLIAPKEHIAQSLAGAGSTRFGDQDLARGVVAHAARIAVTGKHTGRRLVARFGVSRRIASEQLASRTATIDGLRLVVGVDHAMPEYEAQIRADDRPVRSIGLALRRSYGRRIRAIDVGAKFGDTTVALVVAAGADVLAIEGNQQYLNALRQNTAAVSDRVTIFDGFVTADGAALGNTVHGSEPARLSEPQPLLARSGADIETFAVRDALSDVSWDSADLFKSHTSGADYEVIHSALEFPWSESPVLLFAFDPSHDSGGASAWLAIVEEAISKGYRRWYVWDNFGNFVSQIQTDQLKWFDHLRAYLERCRGSGSGLHHLEVAAFGDQHPPYNGVAELRP